MVERMEAAAEHAASGGGKSGPKLYLYSGKELVGRPAPASAAAGTPEAFFAAAVDALPLPMPGPDHAAPPLPALASRMLRAGHDSSLMPLLAALVRPHAVVQPSAGRDCRWSGRLLVASVMAAR